MASAKTIRLTPEEWVTIARILLDLSKLIEKQVMAEQTISAGIPDMSATIAKMHRTMELAAGAVLCVAENAADECEFSVEDAKEEEREHRKQEDNA